MKAFGLTFRIAGSALLLLALQALWGRVWTGRRFGPVMGPPILSCIFVVLALALVASSSHHRGWKLSSTLFILYFGINHLNTLNEALLFNLRLTPREIFRLMASGFCTAVIFTPLLVLILGYWKGPAEEAVRPLVPRTKANWAVRIVLGDILYVVCFVIAGLAVSPFVRDFYAGIKMPSPLSVLAMEVLRGLIYVGAGLAVASGMKGERGNSAVALGLSFPVLAGVAPLLLHNPYMPDYVRLAHGFEIGISNLVYGALLGYILTRKGVPPDEIKPAEGAEPLR
jgi:hypothetical protein